MIELSSSRIQQERRNLRVIQIIDLIEIGRIDVSSFIEFLPPLNHIKKSRIIESLILGLPTDIIWTEQNKLGKLQLLSGFEIIITIRDFIKNDIILKNPSTLTHLNGKRFSDLSSIERRHFLEMDLLFSTITFNSNPLLKCFFIDNLHRDKYRKYSSQLARNITYKKSFKAIQKFSYEIFGTTEFCEKKHERFRTELEFQKNITYFLLIFYLKNSQENNNFSMESYNYVNNYITYNKAENITIKKADPLNSAMNKIVYMLEFDEILLKNAINFLKEYVQYSKKYNSEQSIYNSLNISQKHKIYADIKKFKTVEDLFKVLSHD